MSTKAEDTESYTNDARGCASAGLSNSPLSGIPDSQCVARDSFVREANDISQRELLALNRPAQYLGGEKNSIVKEDSCVDAHIALAFPDTYEVGMSHLGMQILYHIINEDEKAWAERVYMPQADMEELLRSKGSMLSSLESQRPLGEFDVVGFSLQYELCATNILAMLDLSGIPLRAKDRSKEHPVIIAGGPYSYHPEPLAPFIDAFFLGDAEEFMPELLKAIRTSKNGEGDSRAKLLQELSAIEGIYLPGEFEPRYDEKGRLTGVEPLNPNKKQVLRRLLPSMEGAPFPTRPIVPNVNTVHNRLSLEVMRGCVRGCRFCQAGYLYRPQRERSPQEIVDLIKDTLPETGYEEISLLSLSTADYCSVVPLLKKLMDSYGEGDRLAVSFPSTRVDALTPEVLEQVQRVRRTGFTVAPEGGTQRLRDVINKGVSDEQILETCTNVFTMGWSGIKLYFMLGLPTETDDDLRGIIDIAKRIRALPSAAGKDITVSVSTHVPKPHTPFQWAEQISPAETIRSQRLLAEGLREARVNFRYHDHYSSFLEGIFCRAGRELADVIERAYELGCRLDAWKEHISEEKWSQAFLDTGIDPMSYLRERDVDEALPWEHLSCGIPMSYFAKEWKRALRDRTTPDCLTKSCSICGACNYDEHRNVLWPRHEAEEQLKNHSSSLPLTTSSVSGDVVQKIRVQFAKDSAFQFLGHLEFVQVIHRAARRAELPIAYSKGFHPLPKIAFGPPLQLGISSQADFFDAALEAPVETTAFVEKFNTHLPPGIRIVSAWEIDIRASSLQESLSGFRYRLELLSDAPVPELVSLLAQASGPKDSSTQVAELLKKTVIRKGKEKKRRGRKHRKKVEDKVFHLSDYLSDFEVREQNGRNGLEFTLRFNPRQAGPNAIEIASTLSGLGIGDYSLEKLDSFLSTESRGTEETMASDAGVSSGATSNTNTTMSAGRFTPRALPDEAIAEARQLQRD